MDVSEGLFEKITQALAVKRDRRSAAMEFWNWRQEAFARRLIRRIPRAIADAVEQGQYAVDFARISYHRQQDELYLKRTNELYLIPPGSWMSSFSYAPNPEPEYLVGASKALYEYCNANGLYPRLTISVGPNWTACGTLWISTQLSRFDQ